MSTRNRIKAGDGDPRHGTSNGYHHHKCRCRPCTDAWAAICLERKRIPRVLAADDPRHGASTSYRYWHCKCPACRAAVTRAAGR